ncbi:MAG: aspartate/glutamate racemase family protein [Oscillospiraceae bacterium]
MKDFLGVVGGIGPLATTYFMKKVINFTSAVNDQDHINMMVFNHAEIPDRTSYILDKTNNNPYPYLLEDCLMLQEAGAKLIAIPCNTSHYFLLQLKQKVKIPIVDMQKETAKALKELGLQKVGVMATSGTVATGLFQNALRAEEIDCFLPSDSVQSKIMDIIYSNIKAGVMPSRAEFNEVSDCFWQNDCEAIVLGCTELSMLKEIFELKDNFVDALDIAASFVVSFFNKQKSEEKNTPNFLI